MTRCPERPAEVLLVEDDPEEVYLVKKSLEETGIRNKVYVAGDGMEALELLGKEGNHKKSLCPDVILLDLNLPKMHGKDVLRAIKSDEDLKAIPVVIFSSSDAIEDISDAYEQHANSYVTKPANFDQFVKTIKSIEDFWFSVVKLPCREGGWRPYSRGSSYAENSAHRR